MTYFKCTPNKFIRFNTDKFLFIKKNNKNKKIEFTWICYSIFLYKVNFILFCQNDEDRKTLWTLSYEPNLLESSKWIFWHLQSISFQAIMRDEQLSSINSSSERFFPGDNFATIFFLSQEKIVEKIELLIIC